MKPTRHKFRLAIGMLACAIGLYLLFAPAMVFHRLLDGAAWLLIGGMLCFIPEFHLGFNRNWFALGSGLLMAVAGILLTAFAVSTLLGHRPHGLLPFYEFIGIGPLFIFNSVLVAFNKKRGVWF